MTWVVFQRNVCNACECNKLMKFKKYIFFGLFQFFICAPLIASTSAPTGISFNVMRVIYPQSAKGGVTFTINNNSDQPYLVQSLVRPVDYQTGDVDLKQHKPMPFIMTPPLARFDSRSQMTLRIRRAGGELPDDRESVFFLSVKAIPSQQKEPLPGRMAVTVVSNIKLFWRPKALAERVVADVADQIRFRREGNMLIASNPTPYWLTFSSLKVGNIALDKPALRMMVPPKGQQRYLLPSAASGKVEWQLIEEDGWNTPPAYQDL